MVEQQWLSLKHTFVSLKLSLEMFRPDHLKILRDTRSLTAAARNLPSRLRKIRRTRTGCQSLLQSSKRRSKHNREDQNIQNIQIEEAEEIAALNLAKFRKAQQELEETDERAKLAEAKLQAAPTSLF